MVDLGTDRFIRQVRLPSLTSLTNSPMALAQLIVMLSLRSENNRNINKLAVSCYESLSVVTKLISVLFPVHRWMTRPLYYHANCKLLWSNLSNRGTTSSIKTPTANQMKVKSLAHLFTMVSLSAYMFVHPETCSDCKAEHLPSLYFFFFMHHENDWFNIFVYA